MVAVMLKKSNDFTMVVKAGSNMILDVCIELTIIVKSVTIQNGGQALNSPVRQLSKSSQNNKTKMLTSNHLVSKSNIAKYRTKSS